MTEQQRRTASMPTPGQLAGAMFGIVALWLTVLALHLTPALFAALITYGGTRAVASRLQQLRGGLRHAEALSLLLLTVMGSLGIIAFDRAADAAATGSGFAGLLRQMASILEQLRGLLPPTLATHLPASVDAAREVAVTWLREHAPEVQLWGRHTLRGFGYVLAGIVIGGMAALQLPARASADASPFAVCVRSEFDSLVHSFTNVVFAQLRIALINTALTAVYLIGILPLLGKPLPLAGTLVAATFIASLFPVIGNLVSNTMIVVVSLTQSVVVAAISLAWLVGIHKLEYFLNAHIIGQRIRAKAWELLIAMLAFEALFGLGGLISAPVIYAQIKHVLHERGWL